MENIVYHLPDGTHYDPFYCRSARDYIQYKEFAGNCTCLKRGKGQHASNCFNQNNRVNLKTVNMNKMIISTTNDNGNHATQNFLIRQKKCKKIEPYCCHRMHPDSSSYFVQTQTNFTSRPNTSKNNLGQSNYYDPAKYQSNKNIFINSQAPNFNSNNYFNKASIVKEPISSYRHSSYANNNKTKIMNTNCGCYSIQTFRCKKCSANSSFEEKQKNELKTQRQNVLAYENTNSLLMKAHNFERNKEQYYRDKILLNQAQNALIRYKEKNTGYVFPPPVEVRVVRPTHDLEKALIDIKNDIKILSSSAIKSSSNTESNIISAKHSSIADRIDELTRKYQSKMKKVEVDMNEDERIISKEISNQKVEIAKNEKSFPNQNAEIVKEEKNGILVEVIKEN